MRYSVTVDNIDAKLLDKQRKALNLIMDGLQKSQGPGADIQYAAMEGLLNLTDHISDKITAGDFVVSHFEEDDRLTELQRETLMILSYIGLPRTVDERYDLLSVGFYSPPFEKDFYRLDEMRFHASFDWIIPVASSLFKELDPLDDGDTYHDMVSALTDCDLPQLYMAVVNAIKYLNSET